VECCVTQIQGWFVLFAAVVLLLIAVKWVVIGSKVRATVRAARGQKENRKGDGG